MSKIQDYFAQFELDGELVWPDSQQARDKLASDTLGAEIVSSLDHWVDRALDLLHNEQPSEPFPRQNAAWERDTRYRRALTSLTPEQKRFVAALIAETASGSVFSTLVSFDQCAGFSMRIEARRRENEEQVAAILPAEDDLHDRFYDWIDQFSEDGQRYDCSGEV